MPMTLDIASRIADGVLAKRKEIGLKPLTVAVLDAGGHLVAFKREDSPAILRFDIAFGKAWGSLGMGVGSRELLARVQSVPHFIAAAQVASGGRLVPVPGGVLIRDEQGVIGAVGVSGDTSDNDELCAVHAIEAVGLKAQTGAE